MMFDPQHIRYFALDVLTLATDAPCRWAAFTALERTDDANDLVVRARIDDIAGGAYVVDATMIPVAARMAANRRGISGTLQLGVLDMLARDLTVDDAQAIVQQAIYRALRY